MNYEKGFPQFSEGMSTDDKLDTVLNYLYAQNETMRYLMANLGQENFNDSELEDLGTSLTGPLSVRVQGLDETVSKLDVSVDSITLEVTNGSTSSLIKLEKDGVVVAAADITMNGLVTFTGLESGTTLIHGGSIITGTLSADRITTGTLEGVVVKTAGVISDTYMTGGVIEMRAAGSDETLGVLSVTGGDVLLKSNSFPLKIHSDVDLSVEAYGTVYIGSSSASNNVYIGRPNVGRVDLYGDVYINGVLYGSE